MKSIKSGKDISLLFSKGKRIRRRFLNFIVMQHETQHDQPGRAAFITGKKLGNAVWRNKAKRRMKHALLESGCALEGYDILIMATRKTNDVSFQNLKDEIETVFESLK